MKKLTAILVLLFSVFFAYSQASTAKGALTAASNKESVTDALSYLKKTVASMTQGSEKRGTLIILAGMEEQTGNYEDAQKHYAQAAGIQGSSQTAAGVPNKSSEQLVIDAVRCALSSGDYKSADSYLNSSVRQSKDAAVVSYVKLYEQWSALCKAGSASETEEAIAMLKTYSTLESMKALHPSILLTLWHLTGEKQYSDKLKNSYPKTLEAGIVKGSVQILPTPFWYFVPRKGADLPDIDGGTVSETVKQPAAQTPQKESSKGSDKITKQQLGLFKDKTNAQLLCDKVKAKGFDAKIETEKRPSGTTYYLVVVPENKNGTTGSELKNAGFECCPLFE